MCRRKGGIKYEEMVEKRAKANLLTTYDPREHTRYRSAFKLIDLAANYNVDAHGDDSDTASSEDERQESDSEGEEHDEHHKALLNAAAIIGKTPVGKNEAVAREEAMLAKLAEARLLPLPGDHTFKPTLTLLSQNKGVNHESMQQCTVSKEGGMAGALAEQKKRQEAKAAAEAEEDSRREKERAKLRSAKGGGDVKLERKGSIRSNRTDASQGARSKERPKRDDKDKSKSRERDRDRDREKKSRDRDRDRDKGKKGGKDDGGEGVL